MEFTSIAGEVLLLLFLVAIITGFLDTLATLGTPLNR